MSEGINKITRELLRMVSDFGGAFSGAYNIRQDGACAGRQSSANIRLENKTDGPGLVIQVLPGTKGETVYIPACVTHSSVNDLVYNDFYIGEGADVVVVAGCGVHSDGEEEVAASGLCFQEFRFGIWNRIFRHYRRSGSNWRLRGSLLFIQILQKE